MQHSYLFLKIPPFAHLSSPPGQGEKFADAKILHLDLIEGKGDNSLVFLTDANGREAKIKFDRIFKSLLFKKARMSAAQFQKSVCSVHESVREKKDW
jgi:hypothetical protein